MNLAVASAAKSPLGVDLGALVRACQVQVDRDFAPAWNIGCNLFLVDSVDDTDYAALLVLDDSDQANALGYHTTTRKGNPLGKVFVRTSGRNWTVTFSHELVEMLGDPDAQQVAKDPQTGRIYALETCFTGDTRIPLLNGTEVPVAELCGREEFWVYSCKPDGRLRPGRGHSARLTRRDTEILEVILDSGDSIRCTPDHRFLMRDGRYLPACELTPGCSLMPLYRRRAPMPPGNYEYEQCLQPADEKWIYTHRFVEGRCPKGYVRHHKDFNRFNNDPTNIEIMSWEDHQKLHQFAAGHEFTENMREAVRKNMLAVNKGRIGRKCPELSVPKPGYTKEQRRAMGDRGRATIIAYNKSEAHRKIAGEVGRISLKKLWADPEFRALFTVDRDNLKRGRHTRWHEKRGVFKPGCPWCEQAIAGETSPEPAVVNHKVASVRPAGHADVYDFQVDHYHNFALSAGVFVHNCDAVQGDSYEIDGIRLSNFVYPNYFVRAQVPAVKYDHLGTLPSPFAIARGGYMPVQLPDGRWTQIFGSEEARQAYLAGEHSRSPLRMDRPPTLAMESSMSDALPPNVFAAMEPGLREQAMAMSLPWDKIMPLVRKFGPDVLTSAQSLLQSGFSVAWVVETFERLAAAYQSPQPMAALSVGVPASLGGLFGPILVKILAPLIQRALQDFAADPAKLEDLLVRIFGGLGGGGASAAALEPGQVMGDAPPVLIPTSE